MAVAEALRLLRLRRKLTQTAASQLDGAPDCRTLSHWETGRKYPSVKLLRSYLDCLDLDFRDLQGAVEQVEGTAPKRLRQGLERLEQRVGEIEKRLGLGQKPKRPAPVRVRSFEYAEEQTR